MARDFDDDAPRRIQDANELVLARQRDADERICVVTTNLVIDAQEKARPAPAAGPHLARRGGRPQWG
ncbi:hypothetical protein [Streptomyces goshikiensis]|uniref:hypothetical protein n=1 Tax=Streptomyces goshikiensis TaxID=1942 RepID=UPI003649F798